jgi:hypothetical protein
MPDWKAMAIWKQGPEAYQERIEEEEEHERREYEEQRQSQHLMTPKTQTKSRK